MEEKTTKDLSKIQSIISAIIVIAAVIFLGFLGYKYFFGKEVINSNNGYFELTIPGKFKMIENTVAKDNEEIAKYDENKGIYIFGYAYESSEDFDGDVKKSIEFYKNSDDYKNLSEAKEITLNDKKAVRLTYEYNDSNNKKDYYRVVTFINGKNGDYILNVECFSKDKDRFENELAKISDSFKEN